MLETLKNFNITKSKPLPLFLLEIIVLEWVIAGLVEQ